jgi:putative SOS response-associated peptidase YedK
MTKGQRAIREWAGVMTDRTGNLPTFPGVYPNYMAPVVCHQPEGRELAMVRWGMPTPAYVLLKGKPKGTGARSIRDPGTTNIRNTKLPHWRKWFGVANRCVVPVTSFSEPEGERGPPILVRI